MGKPTALGSSDKKSVSSRTRGADHIKILSTGAVLTHGSNAKSLEFTPEELHAAVDEASNFGLRVEAHAHAGRRHQERHPRRIASIEHANAHRR